MILASFFAALGQMGDPRFRRVLGLGIVLTIALLVAMITAFLWLINSLAVNDRSKVTQYDHLKVTPHLCNIASRRAAHI